MSSIFSGLSGEGSPSALLDPKRLFRALPKPADSKFKFPHDIQTEVWDGWFANRAKPDLVLKMNTGSGKTVVGLLILKSSLNEGKGPAVYLVPDKQLLGQVTKTATELGIAWTSDPADQAFRQEEAVLIVTVHTMYNGLSKFGVRGSSTGRSVNVGSIVVDDAHACIPIIENQFSMRVQRDTDEYRALRSLFGDALKKQSLAGFTGLVDGSGSQSVPVPYWEWHDKLEAAFAILNGVSADGEYKFVWPLIRDHIRLADVAFTPSEIEIRLPYPDLTSVPSFPNAQRRIYMTATLADDTVLITQMGVSADCVTSPITPSSASDLGDRIILTPIETSRSISHENVKASAVRWAAQHNVVVIVPSRYRAEAWSDVTSEIHDKTSIESCIARLRGTTPVGLVVLVGRYDGVDLPNDACRVLILDGLPERYSPQELVEGAAIGGTEAMDARQTQRIEQGMGRGIRSTSDYCAVLLLDPRLVERLYGASDRQQLSPGTRAQYELSLQVSSGARGKPMAYFEEAVDAFLDRAPDWTTASRRALESVVYDSLTDVSAVVVAEREAYDLALAERNVEGFNRLAAVFDHVNDSRMRGWVKQRAAAYLNPVDPTRARDIQKSARIDNNYILKLDSEVAATRIRASAHQATSSVASLTSTYASATALEIGIESLLRDLEPSTERNSYKRFESALERLGKLLGFESSRPDQESGLGPDVLWAIGGDAYWVIECKSEATADFVPRKDLEQLSHSMDWFARDYSDVRFTGTPVMIHPSRTPKEDAVPRQGARVMSFERLPEFRSAVRDFASAIAIADGFKHHDIVQRNLTEFHLTGGTIEQKWTQPFTS
ncbi:hypothetical protein ASC66_08165 [Leifsonia sp. Root4]|uniref:helicase C-terminal domain-containing protein n=1 Tax=Leifsonia sp. Root4 TaxID=1736525 RepID=UPI0006F503E1|nr:helicase C-terminal domain-containing protein [Leifsonia sp. Root4]KQW06451.1 hypothetical protein ASC66_08165 [Leifsonia sp. Root4]